MYVPRYDYKSTYFVIQFREEYPHIFYEKYGDSEPLNTSGTKPAEKKKPFRLFNFRF